ncbi:MAG: hypothetical protein RI996_627 [Candidatus Parcubacteria bacterium]|jgi:cell division septal protein FtsQ
MQIRKSSTSPVRAGKVISKKPVSKLAKKRTQKNKKKFIFLIVVCVLLVVVYIVAMRSAFFRIETIEVQGVPNTYAELIKKDTQAYLDTYILGILPKNNIFLFSPKEAERSILQKNSYVESIEYKRKGLHELIVEAQLRTPRFVVLHNKYSTEPIAFVDNQGRIFSTAYTDTSTSTIPLYESIDHTSDHTSSTTTASLPINFAEKIGTTLDTQYISNLVFYIDEISKRNFKVHGVVVKPLQDVDILITPEGGAIRLSLVSEREKVLSTFVAAKKAEPLRAYLANNISQMQYIDLRYGNKVFYKFTE